MNLNEKIALLGSVNILMPDTTEEEANSAIVDYFHSTDPETYEFLLKTASNEDILETAITTIQDDAGKKNAGGTRLSSDPYQSSSNSGGNNGGSGGALTPGGASQPPAAAPASTGKKKSSTDKKDVTTQLAGTLPTASKNKITEMVNSKWENLLMAANSTTVGAYCVDTEVRKYMENQTFVINNDDYKKAFKEKYTPANVIDDSEYGTAGADGVPPLVKEGDNIKAFKTILNKLENGTAFDVRVPEVQNQKVIGILFHRENADQTEVVKLIKDVPIYVLTELGGRVPGQPGIEVTGITSTSKSKTKNGVVDIEEKQAIAVKHRGKVDAMKTDAKYIRYTARALDDATAKKEYGAEQKEYSVSSTESFRYKDKEGKERVMRVRGKIFVPFFVRKDEFQMFGPISASNRVEALTEADRAQVAKLYAAAFHSPQLQNEFAGAAGLKSLVEDLEKAAATPGFNAEAIA